ncbi:MAG: SGNH/GDSL hydrolase family protein [Acidobacteriaceae bacterium]
MKSRRSWWKVAVLCVGLVVGGECLLEVVGLGHPILVTQESAAQYELAPDQFVRRMWPLSDGLISRVRTNRYGMRSGPVTVNRPADTLRVYFLGDSMTYGTTEVDQSKIFASLVGKELPSVVHERVQVLDGAAGGWAPANELAYLREHGTMDANRVILVLNDGDPMQPEAAAPDNEEMPSVRVHPVLGYQELWDRALEPLIEAKLAQWRLMSAPRVSQGQPGDAVIPSREVLAENLQVLTEMLQVVDRSGGRLSIVFLPFVQKDFDAHTLQLVNEGRDAVKRWAAQHGVPFLNLTRELTPYGDRIRLRDHLHLNVEGNALVAHAIVRDWGLLDSTPKPVQPERAAGMLKRGRR